MAIKEWTTNFPATQDADPITGDMPDLADETAPGADDGDEVRSSHVEQPRDKLQALCKIVGADDLSPAGSIRGQNWFDSDYSKKATPVAADRLLLEDSASGYAKKWAEIQDLQAGSAWETVLDLDFSAEANQTLSPDGPYTIGGKTWTKFNSAADSVAMAIVNGNGLVMQPVAATDHFTTTRSLPGISLPLTSIISALDPGTRFRISVYVSAGNWAANYDFTDVWIENAATNTWEAMRKNYWSGVSGALAAIHMYNGADQGAIYNTNVTSGVMRLDIIGGLGSLQTNWAHGAWSSGWPAPSALIPYAYREATGSTMYSLYSGATPVIGAPSSWNLAIGSARAGSGTALSVTVERILVEVKR